MGWTDQIFKWLGHARYKASPSSVGDGQVAELLSDALGRLRVVVDTMPEGGGGATHNHYNLTSPNYHGVIYAFPGTLRQVILHNDHAADVWVALFNKTSNPAPGDIPSLVMFKVRVPAYDTVSLLLADEVSFSTGIAWHAFADVDMTSDAPSKIKVNALYL